MRFRQRLRARLSRLLRSRLRRPAPPPTRRARPRCELLEGRDLPSVALNLLSNSFTAPAGKFLEVPLTGSDSDNLPITYDVTSSDPSVTASVLTGGQSLRLTVSGTDNQGQAFSGDLTLRLFEDLAPITTARIIQLTQSGFYNGLTFHRVLDNFVAQGGDPNGDGTGGSGQKLPDEFNSTLTFTSPGLLAMANAGDDTGDSQFFITDIDLSLAQEPQNLNFQHTIFGQLTSGFDLFNKIMTTPVGPSSSGELSKPLNPAVIQNATVFTDTQNGVLRVTAPATFTGSATLTVTAHDSANSTATQTIFVTEVPDTINDRAFLGNVTDQATTSGTAVSFNLPATDLEGDPLTYAVRDPSNFNATPAHVSVFINQATGRVTVTPDAGFTGTVPLLVGVRDQTARDGQPLDARSQFDTQLINLTVTAGIDLDSASDTGLFNDDNFTDVATPSLTIQAPAGSTVNVQVNGGTPFVAPESSPGTFKVTVPAGELQVGANTVTATAVNGGSQQTLTPLTITYAPSLANFFVVPGAPGSAQDVVFDYSSSQALFHDEVGMFRVDDQSGSVGGVAPDSPGYAQAALTSKTRRTLFTTAQGPGATVTIPLTGGQLLGFYLIQNNTLAQFQSGNPSDAASGQPLAFFGFPAANPDTVAHMQGVADPVAGHAVYSWEDMTGGGDSDYNDLVQTAHEPSVAAEAVRVVAGPVRDVSLQFQLQTAKQARTNPNAQTFAAAAGELGYFFVDDPTGRIGTLNPGDPGYAQAVFNSTGRTVVFNPGDPASTQKTFTAPGDSLLGFYYVKGGTSAQLLASNPSNSAGGSPVAFFSFDAANPDGGLQHFRTFSPEQVAQPAPGLGQPLTLHVMDTPFGTADDFDALVFTLQQQAPAS